MAPRCKWFCKSDLRRVPRNQGRTGKETYGNGVKWCKICETFLKVDDEKRCFCCGVQLRTRARYPKTRKKRLDAVPRI